MIFIKDIGSYSWKRSHRLMRFRVMPFGMVNSGSTYNQMIRKLLNGTQNLKSYVDDILAHTKEHMGGEYEDFA